MIAGHAATDVRIPNTMTLSVYVQIKDIELFECVQREFFECVQRVPLCRTYRQY